MKAISFTFILLFSTLFVKVLVNFLVKITDFDGGSYILANKNLSRLEIYSKVALELV